jgi:hypothetical protein
MRRSWHLISKLNAIMYAMIVAAAVLASAKQGETHETTFGAQALYGNLVIGLEAGLRSQSVPVEAEKRAVAESRKVASHLQSNYDGPVQRLVQVQLLPGARPGSPPYRIGPIQKPGALRFLNDPLQKPLGPRLFGTKPPQQEPPPAAYPEQSRQSPDTPSTERPQPPGAHLEESSPESSDPRSKARKAQAEKSPAARGEAWEVSPEFGLGALVAGIVVAVGVWLIGSYYRKAPAPVQELVSKALGRLVEANAMAPQDVDIVECSVFGPPAARPGHTIMIQVHLHLAAQSERASLVATAMDSSATLRASCPLELPIKRGARVEISFAVNTLRVDEPVQSVVWQGRPAVCGFEVTIPQGTGGQSFFPVVRVSVDGILIGRIRFRISSDPDAASPQATPLGDHARRYENSFVSYAKEDRKEVLKRVQMLQIMKTKFFLDLLSLDPGDRWEKKLYEQIDRCDLFLLFWSQAAKDSQWVRREAEYALKHQQENPNSEPDIVPVILERDVPPPPSLAALHFDDRFNYLIYLMELAEASQNTAKVSAS